jgi:hypothetical protein
MYFQYVKQIFIFKKLGMNVEFSCQQLAWVCNQDVPMRQMHLEQENFQGTPPFVAPGA